MNYENVDFTNAFFIDDCYYLTGLKSNIKILNRSLDLIGEVFNIDLKNINFILKWKKYFICFNFEGYLCLCEFNKEEKEIKCLFKVLVGLETTSSSLIYKEDFILIGNNDSSVFSLNIQVNKLQY